MPSAPKSVYVVEDSSVLADRLSAEIADMGGEVAGVAARASAAIEFLSQRTPDILVLDLALERSSGFEVLHHLKQAAQRPFVIVLSNYVKGTVRAQCRTAGADMVFDKASEIANFLVAMEERIKL